MSTTPVPTLTPPPPTPAPTGTPAAATTTMLPPNYGNMTVDICLSQCKSSTFAWLKVSK